MSSTTYGGQAGSSPSRNRAATAGIFGAVVALAYVVSEAMNMDIGNPDDAGDGPDNPPSDDPDATPDTGNPPPPGDDGCDANDELCWEDDEPEDDCVDASDILGKTSHFGERLAERFRGLDWHSIINHGTRYYDYKHGTTIFAYRGKIVSVLRDGRINNIQNKTQSSIDNNLGDR
ncbi:hypothetical protein [Parasulfitobacter algicola]|nr:hypothetical protein [Sulfitobacter algicola]